MKTIKKTIAINLVIVIATLTQSLVCMEVIWHNPIAKDDTHSALLQRYFSHDSVCALALVNKQWNTCIKQTAQHRRRFLSSQEEYARSRKQNPSLYKQTTWHKHGSAYSYWVKKDNYDHNFHDTIELYFIYLNGNGKSYTYATEGLNVCSEYVCSDYVQRSLNSFFNSQGDVSFHLLEYFNDRVTPIAKLPSYIFEYVLNTKKVSKKRTCYVDITHKNDSTKQYSKENLVAFSYYLREKFIHAQRTTENADEKIYHIDGVEVDEDYLLNGKFPRLTGENDRIITKNGIIKMVCSSQERPRDLFDSQCISSFAAQNALVSRCNIKNGKAFLLLCAQRDNTNVISLLPQEIIKLIASFMINLK